MQATRSAEPQFGTDVGSGLAYVRPELGFGTTGGLQKINFRFFIKSKSASCPEFALNKKGGQSIHSSLVVDTRLVNRF